MFHQKNYFEIETCKNFTTCTKCLKTMKREDIRIRLGTKHYHLDCYDKTNDPSKVEIEKGLNIRQDVKLFMKEWIDIFSLKYKRKRVESINDTINNLKKRKKQQDIYLLDLPSEIWIEIFKYCEWRFIITKFSLVSQKALMLSTDENYWEYQFKRRYKQDKNHMYFKNTYMYEKQYDLYILKYSYLHLYSCYICGFFSEYNYYSIMDINLCKSCKLNSNFHFCDEKVAIKRIGNDGILKLKYQLEYNPKNKNKPLKRYLKVDVEKYYKEKSKQLKQDIILNQISKRFYTGCDIELYICGDYTRDQFFILVSKRIKLWKLNKLK